MSRIYIPANALILLIGCSSSGKSTFARKHFGVGALVSSDECRRLVCGDETRQDVNQEAFELFHNIIDTRLQRGVLTVADATNLKVQSRRALYKLAEAHKRPIVNLILDCTREQLGRNNESRPDRRVPPQVLDKHLAQFNQKNEGAGAAMSEQKYQYLQWPYDRHTFIVHPVPLHYADTGWWVIGDVHACYKELCELLALIPPQDRLVFVGDFVDRGPQPKETLNLVEQLIISGRALATLGNHDSKVYRAGVLNNAVKIGPDLQETLSKVSKLDMLFLAYLPHQVHLSMLGENSPTKIVTVVHGALRRQDRGLSSKAIDSMCIYGETDGTFTSDGFPNRTYEWVKTWNVSYEEMCIFGHTPVSEVTEHGMYGNCINVDTGCAFGGYLTAYNPFTGAILQVPGHPYAGHNVPPPLNLPGKSCVGQV